MPPRKKSVPILGGRARLYRPSTPGGRWQVVWRDPVTGKPKNRTGATKDIVVQKAAEALGDWVDDPTDVAPPTVGEAVEAWIADNEHRWVSRTTTAYRYRARALHDLWDLPVTAVRPDDLRGLADGLSRGQAKRVRTIVRSAFDAARRWTGRPGDRYADAIRLPGTASEDAPREVERTQIPTSEWVSGVIDTCHSTCQLHPALACPGEAVDALTGEHTGRVLTDDPGSMWFVREKLQLGAPLPLISSMRRGIPDHYKDPIAAAQRRRQSSRPDSAKSPY
uniref:Core-binding (CB) domain-containing protein n=1 Tax=Corynebacterium silvaticum TaxID=2320431 RepID=A0A7U5K8P1_9CORY